MTLKDYLGKHLLMTDGAMGTYYAQMTGAKSTLSEMANLTEPKVIYDIHREYIEAGAKLIRTNSFSANSLVLGQEQKIVNEVIQKSHGIAEQAIRDSKKSVYLGASIGPLPEQGHLSEEALLDAYYEIVNQWLDLEVDAIIFETFSDLKYLKQLIPYIKARKDVVIMTEFALNLYGYTKKGISAKRLLEDIRHLGTIDVYGFNCGIGAGHLLQVLRKLDWQEDEIIAAVPNSGYPDILQDRMVYMDNGDYFVETVTEMAKMGVRVIGGCCGTTPDYIKKLNQALTSIELTFKGHQSHHTKEKADVQTNNDFEMKLKTGKKVVAVELDPPFGKNIDKVMEGANLLKAVGVDMITIADSPMGKPRADALLVAAKIRKEVDIPVMPHICCRDKNTIAIKAQVLGAYIEGIRNLLLVTGDPIPSSDRNEISSVFNMNSIQLMQLIKEMNVEHFSEDPIVYGGALNPYRKQLDKEIERMKKKIEAGAKYFLTQPVYDAIGIENMAYIKEKLDTKILGGILPLVNIKNARFVQNEIPGIHIPEAIVQRFSEGMTREEGEAMGIEVAIEMAKRMEKVVDGYYFMVPFNRVHMITAILEQL